MTLDELNKLFRDTINDKIVIPEVIKYYPGAPMPDTAYASINILNLARIGIIDIDYKTNVDDLDESIVNLFSATVSINFYRADARQLAAEFTGVMAMASILENFNSNGVGFTRVSDVRDLTQEFDSGQQERAQVDFFVEFELSKAEEVVLGIDAVGINGTIDNGSEVIDNPIINIP